MKAGALIVAAGMSSRMGDFKPMLNVGSISIAQRVVATFQQAGVDRIVMVTGYNAPMLEHHLSGNGIVFLRNEDFETTQMFDSACIGLRYLKDKCDRILFTPVDIPLFTALTVTDLIDSGAELACPVCGGKTGHPILISSSVVEKILQDSGEGGLQGAISRCGTEMRQVEVEDAGILHDADTPTNVFPSIHVYNTLVCLIAVLTSRGLKGKIWIKLGATVLSVLIILSTLFLKQHSVIDAGAGAAMVLMICPFVYLRKRDEDETKA